MKSNVVTGSREGGKEVMTGGEKMAEQTKSPTVSGSSKQQQKWSPFNTLPLRPQPVYSSSGAVSDHMPHSKLFG